MSISRSKENYDYFKAHKICTRCNKERAMTGATLCPECSYNASEDSRARYACITAAEKERKNARSRDRRKKLKEAGICCRCGKRKAETGVTRCADCRISQARQERDRKVAAGYTPREIRRDLGICYTCSSPALPGMGVCQKCHARLMAVTIVRETQPSDALIKAREDFRKVTSSMFRR